MRIGIATKNSILLLDYAVMAEDEHGLSLIVVPAAFAVLDELGE